MIDENLQKSSLGRHARLGEIAATAGGASAYVVCNRFGDCWHTDTRVHFPHVRLTIHPDSWWERHKINRHYTWYEIGGGHNWRHGYWDHGIWHAV